MRILARPHQLPARLATGLFILDSGLGKRHADEQTARYLHQMATTAYPFLGRIDPVRFTRLLSAGEMVVGAALVVPVVPSLVAGAMLTGFAGGLLGLYLRTEGMRERGSLRPTQEGTAYAKDVWLAGVGAALVLEELGVMSSAICGTGRTAAGH